MLKLVGKYKVDLVRKGKIIAHREGHNGITDEGLLLLLNAMFHGTTPSSPWYVGLITGAGTPSLAAGDTMASHAGWAELGGAYYDETVREEWAEDAAADAEITNTTPVEYNIADTCTIYGIFVCDDNVLAATDGTLWCTAAFDSEVAAVDGDTVRVTYSVEAAESVA